MFFSKIKKAQIVGFFLMSVGVAKGQSIWFEGFEGLTMGCQSVNNPILASSACIPSTWNTSIDYPFVASNDLPYNGTRCLRVRYGWTSWIETRSAYLTAGNPYTFSFYFRTSCPSGSCSGGMTILVGASSVSGVKMSTANMTQVASNEVRSNYVLKTYTFIPSVSGNYFFQIRVTSSNTAQDWAHFDDFNLSNGWPLPVTLQKLEANCEENKKIIRWTTSSERNNKAFVLEKWQKNTWQFFKEIEGKGNSNVLQEYDVLDDDSEEESYYLLSQIDYDGTRETFSPIYVKCKQQPHVAIFPNPASNVLYIQGISADNNIKIIHASGKVVQTIENHSSDQSIDISALSDGIYVVLIQHNGRIESFKWMKM